jgi:prophage antirepressor-like protein
VKSFKQNRVSFPFAHVCYNSAHSIESIIEVNQEKTLKEKFIDFSKNLFSYAGKKFSYVIVDEQIYFKGKDIAEYLGYVDTKQTLQKHVDESERIPLEKIINLGGVKMTPPIWNEKNAIYITEPGLYELILCSKKEEAKVFKKFVVKELLPSLRKTGSYNLSNKISFELKTKSKNNNNGNIITNLKKSESESENKNKSKIKKARCFTIDLLNEKIKKDGATLVGKYDNLCKKSKITFICKCNEKNTKNILVILDKGGAICKKCTR